MSSIVPFDDKMAVPAHIAATKGKAKLGAEWVMPADLTFPRVFVLNGSSAPCKERTADGKPKANPGDIWHSQAAKVYAPYGAAMRVQVIKCQQEFLHWHSRNSKKGLAEKSTDPNSPLAAKCRAAAKLAREGQAKKNDDEDTYNESHSWLLYDVERNEAYVASMARGNIAESGAMLSWLAMKEFSNQAFIFALEPFLKPGRKNPDYYALRFKQVDWATEEQLKAAESIAERLKGKDFSGGEEEAPPPDGPASGTPAEDLR